MYDQHEETTMKLKKFAAAGGILAPRKYGDCGYDLVVAEDIDIPPHQSVPVLVAAECAVKIPEGYWGLIINRSGAMLKSGLLILSSVVDEGYTGPLYAPVLNLQYCRVAIHAGDRLAQLILIPRFTPRVEVVEELPSTERAATGFGSTDKHDA